MKTKPVDVPAFKDLGNPAFAVDTPRDHIALGAVCLCIAKARSGKSRFVTNLLYQLKQEGCMHRIFCLSDTTKSNHKMLKNLDIRPEDVISPSDPDAVAKIVAEIEKERDLLVQYREKMKRWKTFYKNLDVDNTSELLEFYNPYSRQFDKPTHWLDGRKPVIGIFCDDIQSSPLIGSKAFRHLCIMSRHVGAFEDGEPPIGCSLFICVQNYTSQGNEGIPKSIRGNITCCAMWKSGNVKELDLWATELSGIIPKDDILEAYDFVMTRDPYNRHNFLFVDLNPKLDHPSPFRMNYDSWLIS